MIEEYFLSAAKRAVETVRLAYQNWKSGNNDSPVAYDNNISLIFKDERPGKGREPSYYRISLDGLPYDDRFPPRFNRYYGEVETVEFNEIARTILLFAGFDEVLNEDKWISALAVREEEENEQG